MKKRKKTYKSIIIKKQNRAFDDFNATRSDLKDKLQQFEKIQVSYSIVFITSLYHHQIKINKQFDCEEAHSIVSANRSLLILPTDPTQEGDMNIAVRLSEESDRAVCILLNEITDTNNN